MYDDIPIQLPYTLTPKQKAFVTSDKRYTLYSGAVRGGKTLALAYRALYLARPDTIGLVGAHTYKALVDIVKPKLMECLRAYPIDAWREHKAMSSITIKHPAGDAVILMRHLQDEGKIQGLDLDWYAVDEVTIGVKKTVFQQLNARLSRGSQQYANLATNPGPRSHWCYEWFFHAPPDAKDRLVVQAKTSDNPHLPKAYLDDLKQYPESWRRRYVEGEWGVLEGAIFDNFDPEIHVDEREPNPDSQYYLSVDFGYNNPFCCLLIERDHDDNIFVVDEYYKRGKVIKEHADYIRATFLDNYKIRAIVVDPAQASDRAALAQELRMSTMYAKKNVSHGIQWVKQLLEPREDAPPRIAIHPRCTNLIREIESYRWEDGRGEVIKEAPVKVDDHAVDALRYFCYTVIPQRRMTVLPGVA